MVYSSESGAELLNIKTKCAPNSFIACCCCSIAKSCLTHCDSMDCSWSLLKLMSIEPMMLYSYLILCCSLLLLPSIFPSIRVFANESVLCIRWANDWIFSFSISPFNEYSGLISFRIDLFDLLAVQGTLKSLLVPCFKSIFVVVIRPVIIYFWLSSF